MLPAVHRMRSRCDFDAAVRRGRRAGRRTLVVHAALSGDVGQPPRIGFVVSRSVGTAVVRNRVKRRLRALMAARASGLPPGALVVVRANPAAALADRVTLVGDLDAVLPRVLPRPAPPGASGGNGEHG